MGTVTRESVQSELVVVVFFCLLSDFLLLSIIIPYVPQLLSEPRSAGGFGVYSTTLIGLLFSAKPIVQIVANPFAGLATNAFGPRRPLLLSVLVLAASAICFGAGRSYGVLFAARAVQGAASAVTMTSGMTLLTQVHTTKASRAQAMGNAMGGMALGVLAGPLVGGVLYERGGVGAPMYLVAAILALSAAAQLRAYAHERALAAAATAGMMAIDTDPNAAVYVANPGAGHAVTGAGAGAGAGAGTSIRAGESAVDSHELGASLAGSFLGASLSASFLHAEAADAFHHQTGADAGTISRGRDLLPADNDSGGAVGRRSKSRSKSSTGGDEGGALAELHSVFCDPLFLSVALCFMCANAVIGMLEPLFQIYVADKYGYGAETRGVIWTGSTLGYLFGTPMCGALAAKWPNDKRKIMSAGLVLMACSVPLFAAAPRSWRTDGSLALSVVSLAFVGIGMAMVDVPAQPLLADVADYRGTDGYGVAFAIADIAASVGFMRSSTRVAAASDASADKPPKRRRAPTVALHKDLPAIGAYVRWRFTAGVAFDEGSYVGRVAKYGRDREGAVARINFPFALGADTAASATSK
eukprot:g2726.t1